jgi:hypothetical protein
MMVDEFYHIIKVLLYKKARLRREYSFFRIFCRHYALDFVKNYLEYSRRLLTSLMVANQRIDSNSSTNRS